MVVNHSPQAGSGEWWTGGASQRGMKRVPYQTRCVVQMASTICAHHCSFKFYPFVANLTSLAARRDEISRKFFVGITQPSSCLHHLLPAQKDESLTSRLRSQEKFTRVYTRTAY